MARDLRVATDKSAELPRDPGRSTQVSGQDSAKSSGSTGSGRSGIPAQQPRRNVGDKKSVDMGVDVQNVELIAMVKDPPRQLPG